MLVSDFWTENLPVAERFGSWRDMTASALVANFIRSEHEADFRARARLLELGAVQVSGLAYPSLETRRTMKLIRSFDPESYQLMLNLRGSHRMIQGDRDTTCGPGEVMFFDSSRPWQGWAFADRDSVRGVMVQIPRALLPFPANKVDQLIATRLPGHEGMAALLSGFVTQLVADTTTYTQADGVRLATCTLDLFVAFLAHHLDAAASMPPETHHRALRMRIHAFIQQHLGDPDLSPATIAAAHQISVRSLQRLFQDQGLTVAGWIRARRLERCHRDLADPLLRPRPIRAIAARWGFTNSAHFSRAFRAAYGSSPKDYRQQCR